ncbi:unnamed protein product [Polarella glacialis]|uniref:RING-type domain-containing protein n=1 Tax=Polarella glacialis TaxID=89957 RepID=A0A813ILW1_POLGL|nr:unnamed protein product [Polarella glacialis]CAE8651261.1 unnamed protein product [Polarella glacialis]
MISDFSWSTALTATITSLLFLSCFVMFINWICRVKSEIRAVQSGVRSTPAGQTIGNCTPADLAEITFPEVGVLDEPPCAICLEAIAPEDPARKLSCGHAFHASCVSSWWKCSLQNSRAQVSCPSCRVDVEAHISAAADSKLKQKGQQFVLNTAVMVVVVVIVVVVVVVCVYV